MDSTNFKSQKIKTRRPNVPEFLKDVGGQTSKSFMEQLLGMKRMPQKHFSGEILPGENIALKEVISGEHEKQKKIEAQIAFERRLLEEEKILVEQKTNELRLTLHAIKQEVSVLAATTPKLVQELQIAAIQAPVNPGLYHVFFFERLLEAIKSFRKKVDNASVWLHSVNKRAHKKTFWDQYKISGGRRLLSAEDYSQRSAG